MRRHKYKSNCVYSVRFRKVAGGTELHKVYSNVHDARHAKSMIEDSPWIEEAWVERKTLSMTEVE